MNARNEIRRQGIALGFDLIREALRRLFSRIRNRKKEPELLDIPIIEVPLEDRFAEREASKRKAASVKQGLQNARRAQER